MKPSAMCRVVSVAVATFALAAPARAADGGSVLRFIPHADLAIIDPYFSGVYITRNYGYLVYDTLFGMDRAFKPHPEMVDSWTTSGDGLTWDFKLRDKLVFHDGQKVRAAWFEAPDGTSRKDIAAQAQERAFETVPFIPLGQYRARSAWRSNLTGIVDAPVPVFWNVEKSAAKN